MIEFLEDIKSHFESEYPREACGVLGIVRGKMKWFPCRNIALSKNDFVMHPKDYLQVNLTSDVLAIVHSHPDSSNEPSENDINYCNALGIPYYIFSYPDMDLNILQPKVSTKPLIGREYKFGVFDCFEAARDCLRVNFDIHIPNREPFEDDWWKKGLDYFCIEKLNSWGFKEVTEPTPGDLLVFAVDSSVGNHCGIYLGNDCFFHHAVNRLSCRESLMTRVWVNSLLGIYRYEA